jgi:hypothetical protein
MLLLPVGRFHIAGEAEEAALSTVYIVEEAKEAALY